MMEFDGKSTELGTTYAGNFPAQNGRNLLFACNLSLGRNICPDALYVTGKLEACLLRGVVPSAYPFHKGCQWQQEHSNVAADCGEAELNITTINL